MSVEILLFAGAIDGDLPLKSGHATYFGGQPAKIDATGVDLAVTPGAVIGLLKNDSTVDDASGPQVDDALAPGNANAPVIFGANKVVLTQTVNDQVFKGTPTSGGAWVEGQEIYVTGAGIWDNAAAAGGDPPLGRVVKAPATFSDPMHVYMYPRGIDV